MCSSDLSHPARVTQRLRPIRSVPPQRRRVRVTVRAPLPRHAGQQLPRRRRVHRLRHRLVSSVARSHRIASRLLLFLYSFHSPPRSLAHRVVASSPRALWFFLSPPGHRERGTERLLSTRLTTRATTRRRDDARDDANDARDTTTRASSHHRASHARVVATTRRPHPPATTPRGCAN